MARGSSAQTDGVRARPHRGASDAEQAECRFLRILAAELGISVIEHARRRAKDWYSRPSAAGHGLTSANSL